MRATQRRHRTLAARLVVCLACGISILLPAAARAWWNADWAYRKRIALDGAEVPALAATVRPLVVPIRLHTGNFPFVDAQAAGGDLRFVAGDDLTPLPFHLEAYDPVDEIAVAWVQAPAVGAPDAAIWLYYGQPTASAAGSTRATFEAGTVLALHFSEREGVPRDATGYAHTVAHSTAGLGADGISGHGIRLEGTQALVLAAAPSLATAAGARWTASMWVQADHAASTGALLTRSDGPRRLRLALREGRPVLEVVDGRATARIQADVPIAGGSWVHLAFSVGERAVIYVDGRPVADGPLRLPAFDSDIVIGAAEGQPAVAGLLDELRIESVARSPEWMRATALAQHPHGALAQYGADEAGGGSDYLAVMRTLARAVSVDGWVIIGLIGLMGLVSAEVFVAKAVLLGRIARQNADFRAELTAAPADAAGAQPDPARYADATLHRLHASALQARARLGQAADGGALPPQALEVIRAGVEVALVDEARRLNHRMVVLTLAISGAPFLGLLGTVVGIMFTFGSIAMAGDVNVNTIAPGVAAALSTTVAGLLVAIPVMFAYNQLATRIRDLLSASEAYANEVVGRIALQALQAGAAPGERLTAARPAPVPAGEVQAIPA